MQKAVVSCKESRDQTSEGVCPIDDEHVIQYNLARQFHSAPEASTLKDAALDAALAAAATPPDTPDAAGDVIAEDGETCEDTRLSSSSSSRAGDAPDASKDSRQGSQRPSAAEGLPDTSEPVPFPSCTTESSPQPQEGTRGSKVSLAEEDPPASVAAGGDAAAAARLKPQETSCCSSRSGEAGPEKHVVVEET